MPADDATGPTGRAASIGFYANADDSPRVVSEGARPSPPRSAGAAAVASHNSGLVVALTTVLLAGTAIGFAWTLTPAGRETPGRASSTAPTQRPPEPPPAAQRQPPTARPTPAVQAPPAPAVDLARHQHALTADRPKPAIRRRINRAPDARPASAAASPDSGATDLADAYARAIAELDRRRGEAAAAEPPF